jgi:hypothetical protein
VSPGGGQWQCRPRARLEVLWWARRCGESWRLARLGRAQHLRPPGSSGLDWVGVPDGAAWWGRWRPDLEVPALGWSEFGRELVLLQWLGWAGAGGFLGFGLSGTPPARLEVWGSCVGGYGSDHQPPWWLDGGCQSSSLVQAPVWSIAGRSGGPLAERRREPSTVMVVAPGGVLLILGGGIGPL